MSGAEEWRAVVGFEGHFEVSDHGRVRSLTRVVPQGSRRSMLIRGRILSTPLDCHGYPSLILSMRGVKIPRKVHRLVLEAFVGPRPDAYQGCHYDGDPTNNRLDNLRWDTASANNKDRVRHGRHPWVMGELCQNGHAFDGIDSRGHRWCKTCHSDRARQRAARRGADFVATADGLYDERRRSA